MTNVDQQVELPGQTSILDIEPLTSPIGHARNGDPETSHDAAASLSPDTIRLSQQRVLDYLYRWGPLTDTELVAALNGEQSPSGIRTRRRELADLGFVQDSGQRATLKSGRKAILWSIDESAIR